MYVFDMYHVLWVYGCLPHDRVVFMYNIREIVSEIVSGVRLCHLFRPDISFKYVDT